MKQLVIIPILVLFVSAQTYSTTNCQCAQLLSQADCTKLGALNCAWDSTKNTCGASSTTPPPAVTYASYCDPFSQTDCPNTLGCAWVSSKCTFFTGCTPFAKTTDSDCQAISSKCITDGTHCVEKNICSTYVKQTPCVKNAAGKYCYWDTTNNVCVDASTCDKLPVALAADADCRTQISTCTAKTGGGCQDSGNNCSDQTTQISCVWNKLMNVACYWNGTACVDKTCANAPTTLTTDDGCKQFRTDLSCTTKSGGGCITRTTCSAATIQAACVTNSSGGNCYWNGTACVDKTCANAPATMTTNSACQGFLSTCITTGTGCISNGACSVATVQAACDKNSAGGACIWNTTCKDKTCANAPTTNTTHDQCTTYLSSCTVAASGTGCQNRTCANAPTSIVTNAACETYLPSSNCVVASSGTGCVTNAACSTLGQIACVTDVSGNACFWNGTNCVDKICTNALASNTTHANCQTYSTKCTVNSTGAGCIDYTCENSQTSDICTTDSTGKPCIYKGACYQKQCALAPSTTSTHADCQTYLSSCTLNNSGTGCVPLPLKCQAITISAACYLKATPAGTAPCGWNGTQCIDKDCTTLDKTLTTTTACNSALTGCVSANPVNGTVAGCMALPATCTSRQTQDNCEVGATCVWNTSSSTCAQKTCATATVADTTGVLGSVNQGACVGYLTGCTVSDDGTSCIAKAAACSSYHSPNNCIDGAKSGGGDCYWISGTSSCVDKACANIPLTSHSACHGVLNTCTVNYVAASSSSTACQAYAACNTYVIEDQCHTNANNKPCYWTGVACRDQICTDAPSTASYNSVSECENYSVSSGTCTALTQYKAVGGCMNRQASCSGYFEIGTCLKDASNNNCVWVNNTCFQESTFTCANIIGITFDLAGCEGADSGCKANAGGTACVAKTCADYSTTSGVSGGSAVASDSDCSTLDSTCTLDNTSGAVKCQTRAATCSVYTLQGPCTVATEGPCVWDGAHCVINTTACASFTGSSDAACSGFRPFCTVTTNGTSGPCKPHDCKDKTGSGLTDADCSAYDSTCVASSDGNNCVANNTVACSTFTGDSDAACSAFRPFCTVTTNGTSGPCKPKDCKDVTGSGLTDTVCQAYDSTCVASSDGNNCVANNTVACSTFTGDQDTVCQGFRPFCKVATAGTSGACVNHACADKTGSGLTYESCQAYDTTCSVNAAGTACVTRVATCDLYTTTLTSCVRSAAGICGNDGTNCVVPSATNCANYTGTGLNDSKCGAYNAACIANRAGTACAVKVAACTSYSLANCTRSTVGECIGTSDIVGTGTCTAVSASTACTAIFLGSGNYTSANCALKNSLCTNNSTTACQAKTCANAASATSFADCNGWLSSCTWNGSSACAPIAATCASQTSSACYRASEGDCYAFGTLCVKRTCDNAPVANNSHNLCTAYLSTCTVARTGGCIARNSCNTYTSQTQCGSKNTTPASCYWSSTSLSCLDLTCANIDQTSSFNTHNACHTQLNTCTVRAASGAVANGCQSLGTCASYTIQEQCHVNNTSGACEWNTNLATPACVDKQCTTAPSSTNTHSGCQSYLSNTCTVAAVAGVGGAANTLGGCIPLGACSSYIDVEQCKVNATGGQCGWNGTVCADFACTTSPASNNTDSLCSTYKAGCTVDQSGSGCMALLATCEAYQIEGNCKFNLAGAACYWNSTTSQCVTRTCDNAPDATQCGTYLAVCTSDSVKCKTKICEDFQQTTDALCKASLSKCTTDGTQCVLRGTCYQALNQAGCVTDSSNNQCEWIPANGAVQAYCTLKSCATAPTDTYTTESQCQGYFTNCTTKSGGGCVIKSTCALASVQSACTTAADGTKCQWDSTANNCRNKDCQDYQGSTHSACQAINTSCTAGLNGYCARVKSCSNTTVQAACIQGSDGPCLWITDSTGVGACYPYTSCKSITWNTDNKCKAISSNCTTNGTNCLAITLCSETNVSGGCVSGYDGNCIQSVASLGSTDAPVCKAYTSCSDAYYSTHTACQTASYKCTTNGTTGCIALAACSTYTQPGCYVNAVGPVTANGKVTSTGVCTWDNTASSCRDQSCADLTGTNHSACVAQLSTCTSDGTNCLTQAACATYSQTACGVAVGTDGICIWQATTATITTAVCRVMTCADVQSGTTTSVCAAGLTGCVSNGTTCIAKANCSTYTTKTACNSGGLDGVCVFTASTATGATAGTGTCALMTSCSQANNDQTACSAVKSRCAWTAASGTGATAVASKCATHTCATYQATNSVCANFLNWAQTLQQVCQIKSGACTETDPTTLSQTDCYAVTSYSYTWNQATSKCGVCTTPVTPSNNTTNSTNSTNSTTDSGLVLSFATVIFGYLMF